MRAKRGLRVLGLSMLAALGVLAIGVGSAQGQLPGESTLGKFTINGGEALLATATGAQEGSGRLLIAGRNLDIKCEKADVTEGKINSKTEGLATVLYLECSALEHKTNNPIAGCVIPKGEIAAKARLLPILHNSIKYVLAEPHVTGGNFTVLSFESGKGCVLPLNNSIKGAVSGEVIQAEAVQQLVTLSQAIQLLLGDKLLFGTFPAYTVGAAIGELTGAHVGLSW